VSVHARLSPSNTRWPKCPGSIREEEAYPDIPGAPAIDGTGSHTLLELCGIASLKENREVRAEEWLHRTIGEGHEDKPEGWVVEHDRCERVQMALDYIHRREAEYLYTEVEYESRSDPGRHVGRTDWWGTCDITIRQKSVLEVADYKDGRIFVPPTTPQNIGYTGGKLMDSIIRRPGAIDWSACPYDLVRLTIIQPKTNPVIRSIEMTPQELWAKVQELGLAAELTDDPLAPLIAGPHCTWCKHGRAGKCEAKNNINTEKANAMTEITSGGGGLAALISTMLSAPETLTDQQIADVEDLRTDLVKALGKVQKEGVRRLENKGTIPGYTLAPGGSTREWSLTDEETAKKLKNMRLTEKDLYPKKLLTPAALEKLDKVKEMGDKQKTNIAKMISSIPGNPTMKKGPAPANAPESAEEMFKAVPPAAAKAPEPAAPAAPALDFTKNQPVAEKPAPLSFI